MDTSEAATMASPEALEPPPAPAVRFITPAPEDFENPPAMRNLLWPVFWCAVAVVLIFALRSVVAATGWPGPKDNAPAEAH